MNYENYTDDDWEGVILSLHAFAHSLLKKKGWFREGRANSFKEGKEVDDYVYEALGRFFKNPEKFDSTKGTLLNYLKYNLIRSLVSNDYTSSENKSSVDVFAFADKIDEEGGDSATYLDAILPYVDALFDDEVDYTLIIKEVENSLKDDDIARTIFLELLEGSKRREIIEKYNILPLEYDNGVRRLKTVQNKVAKKYEIKRLSL